jgi:hypothetical protein
MTAIKPKTIIKMNINKVKETLTLNNMDISNKNYQKSWN